MQLIFLTTCALLLKAVYDSSHSPVWDRHDGRYSNVKVLLVMSSMGCFVFLASVFIWEAYIPEHEVAQLVKIMLGFLGLCYGVTVNMSIRIIQRHVERTDKHELNAANHTRDRRSG